MIQKSSTSSLDFISCILGGSMICGVQDSTYKVYADTDALNKPEVPRELSALYDPSTKNDEDGNEYNQIIMSN